MGGRWKIVGGKSEKHGRLIFTQYFYFSDKNNFKKLSAAPIISPGLWQSIQEDPENIVDMNFFTNVCTWSYQSTTHRFAWFHGIVPHKSELRRSHVVSSSTRRMHHSSYIKLDHEQLALVTMSNDKLDQLCVVAATSGEC